jgi:hypothetical protein
MPHAPAIASPAHAEHDHTVRTLLYVEDNQANMELVAQLIARRPDMRLLRASDGCAALRWHGPTCRM